jgi:hypothetical protein
MTRERRIRDAANLFEGFSGEQGEVVGHVDLPEDDVLMLVGICEAIAYTAVRDGERASYQHEFMPSARPALATSSDGKRLYLIAGSYEFTHRGIEDKPKRSRSR